jgi:hypothetical protein
MVAENSYSTKTLSAPPHAPRPGPEATGQILREALARIDADG